MTFSTSYKKIVSLWKLFSHRNYYTWHVSFLRTKMVIKSFSNGLSCNVFEFQETCTSDGCNRTTFALAYLFGTVFKLFVRKIKQYEIEKQKDYLYRNWSYLYDQWSNPPWQFISRLISCKSKNLQLHIHFCLLEI